MVEMCMLIVWLFSSSVIWLFCGMCFLVIFRCVIILICEISSEVSLWLGCNILCNVLLIWKWIIRFFLNVLMWIFEVFFLIVFVSMVLISLMIGVLLLFFSRFFVFGSFFVRVKKFLVELRFFISWWVLEEFCC